MIPALVLSKLSSPDRLGPALSLALALAFPIIYGAMDFFQRKKTNAISILGFFSVLLTGGLSLLKVDGFWFRGKGGSSAIGHRLLCCPIPTHKEAPGAHHPLQSRRHRHSTSRSGT